MDENAASAKRLMVAAGVCVFTFFGFSVSLYTEPEERPKEVKIVYVPDDNRGEPGPLGQPGTPTREDVDAAIDK